VSEMSVAENIEATAELPLDLLRCPVTRAPLDWQGDALVPHSGNGELRYRIDPSGIPLFAEQFCSEEARVQEAHYNRVAAAYVANLGYPHTQEYMAYLDDALLGVINEASLGTVAEICCGRGEALHLLGGRIGRGVGVDISPAMLRAAQAENAGWPFAFVQGDATMLPLADAAFDSVFMLGGIHHVNDRAGLFGEVARVLKPGGRFYFREPVSDFLLWQWLRTIVYRLSPALDYDTERPLRHAETVPPLRDVGLVCQHWKTHGFLGFCLFMNSDVLVFNRLFRFVPGIRFLTRLWTKIDEWTVRLPGLHRAGLQVVGVAERIRD
jgi:SAM-dependent methyltransferase